MVPKLVSDSTARPLEICTLSGSSTSSLASDSSVVEVDWRLRLIVVYLDDTMTVSLLLVVR